MNEWIECANAECAKIAWRGLRCSKVGCSGASEAAIRFNSTHVIPLCSGCEAQRISDILRDGEACILISRDRLVSYPE